MDRTPRRRRLLATALAAGALVAVAVPQLVAADPAPTVWPVDLHPTVATITASSPVEPSEPVAAVAPAPVPTPAPVAAPAPAPVALEEAAAVSDVPEIPDVAVTEPAPLVTPEPASVVDAVEQAAEVVPLGGTLTVHVAPAEGADRAVSVRPVDGGTGVGPLVVGSETIVVDLAAGTYDLLVEQIAHGGGAFVTRTRFTMDPDGQVAAACDPETLECAVVA